MAMPISLEEFEKRCNNKVIVAASYEKDLNAKIDIENVGRAICKCMADNIANPRALHRVMSVAVHALPAYTVGRENIKVRE